MDWLIRRYGFRSDEIPFDAQGNLALNMDPKQHWAQLHPEYFPVNLNTASREQLLRVPGLGEVTVGRILKLRQAGRRLKAMDELGRPGKRLSIAGRYTCF